MKQSILITGVGAIIGQGIIKSLQGNLNNKYRTVGIDANPHAVGFAWVDKSYQVPFVHEPEWSHTVREICRNENIILILPGIEQDIEAFLQHSDQFSDKTQGLVLLNSPETIKLGFDKWELHKFAVHNKIKVPQCFLANEVTNVGLGNLPYPLLFKPRRGMASKGIHRADNKSDAQFWLQRLPLNEYIVQEYIGNDEEEYTVGIFGYKNGKLSEPFILKRRLNYGSTFEAETYIDDNFIAKIKKTAQKMKINGPTNLQYRRKGNDFYLIEVNPRFSSSISIRSAFGFNEPLMAINSFIEETYAIQGEIKQGRCSRYITDHITYK